MKARRCFTVTLCCAAILSSCSRPTTLTPEQASAKGDALLRKMSQTLAAAKTFSFTTDQMRERVRSNGTKVQERFSRHITVRRPNALALTDAGGHEGAAWYDGKHVTFVSNKDKAWARGPMPGNLDEAMDFVSAEYAIQLPIADLLYSTPYDAMMTKDTKGGWVDAAQIGDRTCDHLSYSQEVVDWQLWLTQDDRGLPCQLEITYKTDPGKPMTRVIFSDWNPAAQVSDDTFTAKIPDGFQRIKMMRHVTAVDPNLDEAGDAAPAKGKPAAGKQPR
jgi:hypothetical protein